MGLATCAATSRLHLALKAVDLRLTFLKVVDVRLTFLKAVDFRLTFLKAVDFRLTLTDGARNLCGGLALPPGPKGC